MNVRWSARTGLVALVVLTLACSGEVECEIVPGVDACRECGMLIDRPGEACGYVHGGEFVTFDSPVCLLRSYEALRKRGEEPLRILFADHRDGSLHTAETTAFLLTDEGSTVMGGGVLCFSNREAAEAERARADDPIVDWQGFRVARGTPDRVLEVSFGSDGMTPEAVGAVKGDLVLWKARARGLESDLVIAIKGYPETGDIAVPASGTEVLFRMRASRPGQGFPIVRVGDGETLGAFDVSGAHTADEELR